MTKKLREYVRPERNQNRTFYPKKAEPRNYSWEDTFEKDPREFCPKCENKTVLGVHVSHDMDWGLDHMHAVAKGIEGAQYMCEECNFYYAFPPRKPRGWMS